MVIALVPVNGGRSRILWSLQRLFSSRCGLRAGIPSVVFRNPRTFSETQPDLPKNRCLVRGLGFGVIKGTSIFLAKARSQRSRLMETNAHDDLQQLQLLGEPALTELFSASTQRLERILRFRIDPRIRSRIDATDVLQETWVTASRRMAAFLQNPTVSPFVWLRQLALQTLIDIHRRELCHRRDAGREIQLVGNSPLGDTSLSIAHFLADQITSPSQHLMRAEDLQHLQAALNSMPEVDREVLALRHFEQLTNQQTAEVLGLTPTAASNRYVRAAARLTEILQRLQENGPQN
jgi:RNA polymerase sigma-70 factor (ECF subfamily)